MKRKIMIGSFLFLTFSLSAQKVLFRCDFEQGIPETFLCYDQDGNEPARGMKKYGLETGTAWAGYTENPGTAYANGVACSGSWYKEPGQSDDWLVTPAITITSKQAILSWKAHATDKEHRDGYAVYITDEGDKPADFTKEAVFSVTSEEVAWTEHRISLKEWVGKQIHIAFVNNSTDCKILAIDDISVFVPEHSFLYICQTPEAVSAPGNVQIKGGITPPGFLPVNGYKAILNYNGETFEADHSEEIIEPGDTAYFEFQKSIPVALDETVDYTLFISSETEDVMTENKSITCFERTVIAEEGTGTWCIYCPRGQVGLSQLREKYGKKFIDIAVHMKDPMTEPAYMSALYPFFTTTGIPQCVMNRNPALTGDPYYGIEELFLKALQEGPLAKIQSEASLTEEQKLSVKATVEFAKPVIPGTYSLAFVVAEDSVSGYEQANFYSGGNEKIGNLADLPDPIPAGEYYFANVGRMVYPSPSGDPEAFNSPTARRTPIEIERLYEIPASVTRLQQVKIVALVIDLSSGRIVNAAECPLNIPPSGIKSGKTDGTDWRIFADNYGNIEITNLCADVFLYDIEFYASDGRLLQSLSPGKTSRYVFHAGNYRGIGLVKIKTSSGVIIKKIKL